MEALLFSGWLWEMYSEYVRKIRRTASTGSPQTAAIEETYQKIFPEASIKILVEEKVGMIVTFNELETRPTPALTSLRSTPQLMAYLAETYGRGKFKINFYHGATFLATHNFKVLDETLPERWRQKIVAQNPTQDSPKPQAAPLPVSATPQPPIPAARDATPTTKTVIPLRLIPSDSQSLEEDLRECFDEDKVTHHHGHSEPEAD